MIQCRTGVYIHTCIDIIPRKIDLFIASIESMTGDKQIHCICMRGIESTEAARLISGKSNLQVFIDGG
jgi:hypothetical protein